MMMQVPIRTVIVMNGPASNWIKCASPHLVLMRHLQTPPLGFVSKRDSRQELCPGCRLPGVEPVQGCSRQRSSPALVQLRGDGNRDITLALNRVSKQTQEVVFADGASEQGVVRRI